MARIERIHHAHGKPAFDDLLNEVPGARAVRCPNKDKGRLDKRLQFEELISKLSAIFVNLPPDQVEMEIEEGLKLIGEFLRAERCILIINKNGGDQFHVSNSWLCKERNPCMDIFPHKPDSKLINKLRNGEDYVIKRAEDIPQELCELRDYIKTAGIKSSLILSLNVGGKFLGSIGIDFFSTEYDWPNEILTKLRFIADVFSNAISRKTNEEILQHTLAELDRVKSQLEADCTYLQNEIKLEHNFDEIIGHSRELKRILSDVETVAPTDVTVLIQGETGTGKELFARAIHANSRKDRPLVKVNCAALPSNLIENELFGHVKGAFTGAQTRLIGRFELANGGTLFLDEISELPLELQPKLLRVLQEGEFERLGSSHSTKVDIRIIAATNRDLEQEVLNDRFRKDLWYRLNVFPIRIPPLRERTEDIPPLVNWLVKKFNRKHAKSVNSISRKTMEALEKYPWPGNIRELQNVIERAIIIAKGNRLLVDLPKTSLLIDENHSKLEDVERNHIHMMLKRTKWRISGSKGAANILGLHPNTLRWRMQKLGIEKPWE